MNLEFSHPSSCQTQVLSETEQKGGTKKSLQFQLKIRHGSPETKQLSEVSPKQNRSHVATKQLQASIKLLCILSHGTWKWQRFGVDSLDVTRRYREQFAGRTRSDSGSHPAWRATFVLPFRSIKDLQPGQQQHGDFLVYEMMLSLLSLHFLHLSRLGAPRLLCTFAFRCSTAQSKWYANLVLTRSKTKPEDCWSV